MTITSCIQQLEVLKDNTKSTKKVTNDYETFYLRIIMIHVGMKQSKAAIRKMTCGGEITSNNIIS